MGAAAIVALGIELALSAWPQTVESAFGGSAAGMLCIDGWPLMSCRHNGAWQIGLDIQVKAGWPYFDLARFKDLDGAKSAKR